MGTLHRLQVTAAQEAQVSRRWPGWEDLAGINVEGGCNAARKQGHDYVLMHVMAGPEGVHGPLDMFPVAFHADGSIGIEGASDDWECIVEDGMLTGIRYVPDDLAMKLVKALFVQVGTGDMPVLHHYVAGEMVEGGSFTSVIDAAIDCSAEPGADDAMLSILLSTADDQVMSATWPLTPESARALLGLMRERHGDPAGELLTDRAAADQATSDLLADPGTVGVDHG